MHYEPCPWTALSILPPVVNSDLIPSSAGQSVSSVPHECDVDHNPISDGPSEGTLPTHENFDVCAGHCEGILPTRSSSTTLPSATSTIPSATTSARASRPVANNDCFVGQCEGILPNDTTSDHTSVSAGPDPLPEVTPTSTNILDTVYDLVHRYPGIAEEGLHSIVDSAVNDWCQLQIMERVDGHVYMVQPSSESEFDDD